MFFHIFGHLYIPYMEDVFVFFLFMPIAFEIVCSCVSIQNTNAYEILSYSHKFFTFSSHICSFTFWSFKYSLFGRHIFLSFLPIIFEIMHAFVFIHNALESPHIYHKCKLGHGQIWGTYVNTAASSELTEIKNVTSSTSIHTLQTNGTFPWTNLSARLHTYVPLHCFCTVQIDPI